MVVWRVLFLFVERPSLSVKTNVDVVVQMRVRAVSACMARWREAMVRGDWLIGVVVVGNTKHDLLIPDYC
jgi:hypothetical protein